MSNDWITNKVIFRQKLFYVLSLLFLKKKKKKSDVTITVNFTYKKWYIYIYIYMAINLLFSSLIFYVLS